MYTTKGGSNIIIGGQNIGSVEIGKQENTTQGDVIVNTTESESNKIEEGIGNNNETAGENDIDDTTNGNEYDTTEGVNYKITERPDMDNGVAGEKYKDGTVQEESFVDTTDGGSHEIKRTSDMDIGQ